MRSRRLSIARAAMAMLILSTAGQLATAPVAHAQSPSSNAVADVEKSVIQLVQSWKGYVQFPTATGSEWSGELEALSVCSGFFVTTTGHAVTAGHCVEPAGGRESLITTFLNQQVRDGSLSSADAAGLYPQAMANWEVEGADGGSPPKLTVYAVQPHTVDGAVLERVVIAQVLDFRPTDEGDVALLKVEAADTPALPVAAADPPNNTPVTAIGFPAAVAQVVDESLVRADFKSGTVSSHQTSRTGVPVTGVNADLSGGMSGGPTVDERGNVLGVNSAKISGEQNFNFITDTSDLRDWLQGKGLPLAAVRTPEVAPAPTPAPSGTPSWVWIVLVGAAVALVAGGVLLFVARRRRAPAPVPAPQPSPFATVGAPQPWGTPPSTPSWGGPAPAAPPWAAPPSAGPWNPPPAAPFGSPTPAPAGQDCPACGTSVPAGNPFCGRCGRQMN